jgi:hypothetical protein
MKGGKMKPIKRVYVAGPYSANNVIDVLENIRNGLRLSTQVFLAGFSPFAPWLDFHYTLMLQDNEKITIDDYYKYSIDWLEVSDAMLLIEGWENSKGTLNEIEVAKEKGIPIFYDLETLMEYTL